MIDISAGAAPSTTNRPLSVAQPSNFFAADSGFSPPGASAATFVLTSFSRIFVASLAFAAGPVAKSRPQPASATASIAPHSSIDLMCLVIILAPFSPGGISTIC